MTVTPVPSVYEMLTDVTDECLAVLLGSAEQDWSRRADGLDWTCRQTLDHVVLGVLGYAGLLIARPTDRYITLFGSLDPAAPIPACLEGVRIAATLLGTTVRATPADVRAWHPWGHSDASGFTAMGMTELTLHTYDITRTFGVPWTPPDAVSSVILDRLFPDAPSGHGPTDTLLWCTGRLELPGLPRRTSWQWHGASH